MAMAIHLDIELLRRDCRLATIDAVSALCETANEGAFVYWAEVRRHYSGRRRCQSETC